MAANDEPARKARAQTLRQQIRELKEGRGSSAPRPDRSDDPDKANYRTLIDERMHELDDKRGS